MSNKVFVGGLSWGTTEDSLRKAFEKFGDIEEVKIITDRDTGRSRGFGFITFVQAQVVNDAVSGMDGTELDGRNIKVSIAQDKPKNRNSGGGSRNSKNNQW
ncbi:MAG: RNA-binding protein [Oligoflexales bacterium]|nr:RNA-binding protein [Oligoflexales bacterium]